MAIMMRLALVSVALLAASAQAADQQKITAAVMHTAFTGDYGSKDVTSLEYVNKQENNTYVVNVAAGERDYKNELGSSFEDKSLAGTYYRDWNSLYSTRTSITASTNSPVFVLRLVDQDITYKGIAKTTLTIGAKHAEYYGDVTAKAWYLSGAYYLDRITTRLRLTHYDLSGVGDSYGASLMVQLKDMAGGGATQLWLGKGTSINEYVWSPVAREGNYKSAALRRIQPLNQRLSLSASLEQAWYDTAVANYRGTTGQLALTYSW